MYQRVQRTMFLTKRDGHPAIRLMASPEPQHLPAWFTATEFYKEAVERGNILEVRGKPPAPPAEEFKGEPKIPMGLPTPPNQPETAPLTVGAKNRGRSKAAQPSA